MCKSYLIPISLIFVLIFSSSCNECENVLCQNGGTCDAGDCICPEGFLGENCEFADPTQIQVLLDNGKTPIELFNAEISLDSLYGKNYQDGFIFYLDTVDGNGLLAAMEDQSFAAEWGSACENITALLDGIGTPLDPETAEGARIGDGESNTNAILAECSLDGIAAKLCRDLGEAWFLPSRAELNLMKEHLHDRNMGLFFSGAYWSSTENGDDFAWGRNFFNQDYFLEFKSETLRVRAARAF